MGINTQGELSTALILLGAEVEDVRYGDAVHRYHTMLGVRVSMPANSPPSSRTAVTVATGDIVRMQTPKHALESVINYLEAQHDKE